MKKCMGAKVGRREILENMKCQNCAKLARGEGIEDDKVKEWYAKPAMPCRCFKEVEK